MKGMLEVSVREIIQRASSSLLVRNTNAGNYDFDAGARLWGRDGVDGGTAVADAASVSSASGALNASAHSLLRRLFLPITTSCHGRPHPDAPPSPRCGTTSLRPTPSTNPPYTPIVRAPSQRSPKPPTTWRSTYGTIRYSLRPRPAFPGGVSRTAWRSSRASVS